MTREDLYPSEPPVLELERLRIRPVDTGDVLPIFNMWSDEETTRYLARPKFEEPAEAEAMVQRILAGYEDGSLLQLAIERKADRSFVGLCILFHYHTTSKRAEIGYSLAREHWSKGYMAEALRGLVGHAFDAMQLNRLEADIDPRNAPSARVLERLGFQPEGRMRERWIVKGEVSDTMMYGLLRSDWPVTS